MKEIALFTGIVLGIAFHGYSQLWTNLDGGFATANEGGPLVFYIDPQTSNLILGGGFWNATNGDTLARIAQWDGSTLQPIGCGFDWNCQPNDQFFFGNVISVIRYEGQLIASGGFYSSCEQNVTGICSYEGNCWIQFGSVEAIVPEFKIHDEELYACGVDLSLDLDCNGFAKWNGSTWLPVFELPNFSNNEIGNNVMTCEWFQDDLYLGGNWNYTGTDFNYDDMVMWNGEAWTPVGDGFSGSFSSVRKLTVFKNKLIAIGGFQGPNNPGNFIAAWDGQTWDDMDGGLSNPNAPSAYYAVNDMWATDEYLYVVGGFAYAGGMPAHGIARWDGESWCGYGTGTEFNGFYWENMIHSVCIYNNELIIGGDFLAAQDHPNLNLLARYIGPDSCLFTSVESLSNYTHNSSNHELLVYPNPASSHITVRSTSWKIGDELQLYIYDVLGNMVLSSRIRYSEPLRISIATLPSGSYALKVARNGDVFIDRFVRE